MSNNMTALVEVPQTKRNEIASSNVYVAVAKRELTEKIESTCESVQELAMAPMVASVEGSLAVPEKSPAKPTATPNALLRFRVRRHRRYLFEQILWSFAPPCVIATLFLMFRIADASQVGTYLLGFSIANLNTSIALAQSLERFAEPSGF